MVLRLDLQSLAWERMELRLPHPGRAFPCFKLKASEAYLVMNKSLYSFTALQVTQLKTLPKDIKSWYGPSYYSRGTLYCSSDQGAARLVIVVRMTNMHA
jgi:hypothetical protein